jgi:hypothetical protein
VGLSVFYCGATDDITTNLATFFNAIKAWFPPAVSWQIPNAGDEINDDTGTLVGSWTGGTAASIVSTGTGAYAAGTGALAQWRTGAIVHGHKLQGRTFLNPFVTSTYDANGQIGSGVLTPLQAACAALAASNKLVLWHRPTTPGGTDGTSRLVISGTASSKVSSLRSRRV